MTEDEYDELMKKALTNSMYWQGVTATQEEAAQAKEWLVRTQRRITNDFRAKKAQWGAISATLTYRSPKFREELARYRTWEAKAIRFQGMVESRLAELADNAAAAAAAFAAANPPPVRVVIKSEGLEKAHAHSEYMQKQHAHVSSSLIKLAAAVDAFDQGDTTLRDLVSKLDELTVPHDGTGERSLRQVLDAIAEKAQATS